MQFKLLRGFTLTELMVVVAIVGILAAVAYPAYTEHVVKTRRTDAQASLMDLAARMERHFAENNTYANATIASAAATDVLSSATSPEGWYTLAITAANGSSYTLQATPQNAQGTADTWCQSLTLNSLGARGVANGPAGAPTWNATQCWR